jgi:hypothetical protein
MSRRYYSSIAERTTLSFAVNASTTTFIVNAVVGWPSNTPYTLIIDVDTINEEIVTVTNRSGTTLTVTRGVDGSTAKTHDSGADVRHGVSGRDFDEPNAHLNDTTTAHGLTIADVVTDAGTQTLTNKTINSASNTLTVAQSAVTNLTTDLAAKFPLNVSTNPQTASYTLVAGDAQKVVEMNVATANTLTVPTNDNVAFPVGTSILVVQTGAGQTTIAGAAGVTVNSFLGLKMVGQWAGATLIKRATNTWVAVGGLVA